MAYKSAIFAQTAANVVVAGPSSGSAASLTARAIVAADLPLVSGSSRGAVIVGTGITNTSGTISVAYGTSSGTAAQGNDTRITGALQASNNLSDVSNASSARSNLGLGTLATQSAASVNITGGTITGLGTPSASSDAAPKSYVDSVAQGLSMRQSVFAATTAALPNCTYNNGTSGYGATLTSTDISFPAFTCDGVSPIQNDRILVKNQANSAQNGIYNLVQNGDGFTMGWILSRSVDFDSPTTVQEGAFVFVEFGSTLAGSAWVCQETDTLIVVGTTLIPWAQFASAGSGSVTSVGLSLPSIFAVSGSPVTVSGTLTATLQTQTANTVFAGPSSGSAAAPTFRALTATDIPSLPASIITSGTIATARLGSGTASSTTFLAGDQSYKSVGTVTSVAATVPSYMTVSGSPVTTSGTLAFSFNSQSQNLVFASPSGSSGAPTFRALTYQDIAAPTVQIKTGSYTILSTDQIVINQASGTNTFTMPNAGSLSIGQAIVIKNSGTGTLTVNPATSQTFENTALSTFLMDVGDALTFIVDSTTDWIIV